MSTPRLFEVPETPVTPSRATKVYLTIEIPEEALSHREVWPHGGPEDWDVHAVVAELKVQYGDSVSIRSLADEWGLAESGGELILRDDLGNVARMELRA